MSKTILSCAVTGNQTTLAQHPGLPCTPEQIATACIDAAKAGAAITHIHVRYPDGRPSMELAHYKEVVDRIRDSSTDVIINLTTGPGQRFIPGKDDPSIAAPGTTLTTPMRRVEHVIALKPEICTLDLNTMWSGTSAVINSPQSITVMAQAMKEAGSKPELEVFDSGDIQLAKMLIEQGVLDTPAMFQIVTGIRFGFEQTPQTMAYAKSLLPPDAVWAGFGIGRMAFPMLAQAFLLGGHVRVGLEDAVNLRRGVLAPSNAAMVEKAVHIVDELGGEIATVKEARAILGLGK
ncbi:MAG: 3-keto-5-aminohexanoate cleavage protein [Beijerinckiaceae bacterium]